MNQDTNINLDFSDKFEKDRAEWTNKIQEMSKQLSKVELLSELQTWIFSERQIAVEYKHFIIGKISKVNKAIKKKYAERYDFYSLPNNKECPYRYPEQAKTQKIWSDLADINYIKEVLENHLSFIDNTIKTIDNIIFGINNKIKIEDYIRGN